MGILRKGPHARKFYTAALLTLVYSPLTALYAREIVTNNIHFPDAPDWLTSSAVERVTGRVQDLLEWDIRKIRVRYHSEESTYKQQHNLNFESTAFFRRSDSTVHLSRRVTKDNFDGAFGHELVHVIFFQKYKQAIPKWLEEGLANHIGRTATVDYPWLSRQSHPDVTQLTHPDKDAGGSRYHYQASTALIDMIASHCSLLEVLRLSVGAKMTTYLRNYCEITDINAAFREWVTKKSSQNPVTKATKRWW